ncbi:SUR7/PalI family-domain-containing protein [Chaetomium strumarium]|uniref:SUR7/PalI family-domain-containing protein n=1 Tax=Chaetomium strumarium TaxID=1170767 RepID=A0AAJ0H121_9PEZI|nr:SUR7/PalI family-domain-containing protein [Chaetomium strumarium]
MAKDLALTYRLLPLLCSLVSFILVMLAIFAGYSPGILEGYDILLVNISGLRKDPVNMATALTSTPTRTNTTDNVIDNDVHIPGFFTLHLLTICEGDFTENGSREVSGCHRFFSSEPTKISLLNNHLPRTPFGDDSNNNTPLNTYLGISDHLAAALDNITTFAQAAAVLCSIGVTLTCLSFLLSIPYYPFLNDNKNNNNNNDDVVAPPLVWANFGVTVGSLFFLLLGVFVASIGAVASRDRVNDLGEDAGVGAVNGTRWVVLAWVAFALMLVVLATWVWEVVRVLRKRKKEKKGELVGEEAETEAEAEAEGVPHSPPVPPPSFGRPPPAPPYYRPSSRARRSSSRRREEIE